MNRKADPDEKGTESWNFVVVPQVPEEIAKLIPMKRELKVHHMQLMVYGQSLSQS